MKLLGTGYLVYLGAQSLRAAFSAHTTSIRADGGRGLSPIAALRAGLVGNLGNPKMAAFFPSLLPQFAPRGDAAFATLLVLGLVFCVMTLGWLVAYSFAVARTGDVLRRPKIRRTLDAIAGTVLVGFGVRLATEQR